MRAEALLAELQRYQPDDALEARHLSSIIELLAAPAQPFTRSQFEPGHITASAFVLDPDAELLLLHHHRRLDRWLQMGGHLDPGEDPLKAALREAAEESGCSRIEPLQETVFDLDVHPIPAAKGEPAHYHFDLRYLFRAASDEALALDPAESLDLRWFRLEEAGERMNEEGGYRVMRKIRRWLERKRS
jgi:8-oxo-dGTP pyrophosphatase MutT (NUDIX family)